MILVAFATVAMVLNPVVCAGDSTSRKVGQPRTRTLFPGLGSHATIPCGDWWPWTGIHICVLCASVFVGLLAVPAPQWSSVPPTRASRAEERNLCGLTGNCGNSDFFCLLSSGRARA